MVILDIFLLGLREFHIGIIAILWVAWKITPTDVILIGMEKKQFIIELAETFLFSVIILFLIYMSVGMPEVVFGSSMEPSYHTGERILVEKLTKYFKDYERGEVIVLNPPGKDSTDYIKRIIGIPGDAVKIYNCKVFVTRGGERFTLDEPYLAPDTCTTDGPVIGDGKSIKINSGEYLVLGDNREVSADSRYFGVINRDRIMGRVVFRFWPLNRTGFVH